jgi:hypothetical protein
MFPPRCISCETYGFLDNQLWRGAKGKEATVCLGIVCIMLVFTAGCNYARYPSGDMTEKDCERVSGIDREHCYKNLIVNRGNSTLCEKVEDPGPKSKSYLELGECSRLSFQATWDGAYTKYDCYQYKAIQERSVRLCDEFPMFMYRGTETI